jgi:hypothetical protein
MMDHCFGSWLLHARGFSLNLQDTTHYGGPLLWLLNTTHLHYEGRVKTIFYRQPATFKLRSVRLSDSNLDYYSLTKPLLLMAVLNNKASSFLLHSTMYFARCAKNDSFPMHTFVKLSASWSNDLIYVNLMIPSLTMSRTQYSLGSMCIILLWGAGLLLIAIAALLSSSISNWKWHLTFLNA